MISILSRTSCATSFRSYSFSFGINTFVTPARCAAISFSGSPPMGVTAPRRETSPVMAMWVSTTCPVRRDARAVVSVTPADGPSFGTAPAGTWICRSFFSSFSASFGKRLFTRLIAILADSFITSPSWPVMMSSPFPFVSMVSM